MSRVTLDQYKANLKSEASDIDLLLERRLGTPENRARLDEINRQLKVFESVEKPDSMTKKLKKEKQDAKS